ncbi:MAG: DUF4114 domain-containing protein [Cyanobacteria bacterium P01_D01_bin.56]
MEREFLNYVGEQNPIDFTLEKSFLDAIEEIIGEYIANSNTFSSRIFRFFSNSVGFSTAIIQSAEIIINGEDIQDAITQGGVDAATANLAKAIALRLIKMGVGRIFAMAIGGGVGTIIKGAFGTEITALIESLSGTLDINVQLRNQFNNGEVLGGAYYQNGLSDTQPSGERELQAAINLAEQSRTKVELGGNFPVTEIFPRVEPGQAIFVGPPDLPKLVRTYEIYDGTIVNTIANAFEISIKQFQDLRSQSLDGEEYQHGDYIATLNDGRQLIIMRRNDRISVPVRVTSDDGGRQFSSSQTLGYRGDLIAVANNDEVLTIDATNQTNFSSYLLAIGGSQGDTIIGTDFGGSAGFGQDYLIGRDGNDIIFGNAGNDLIEGGSGDDILVGGRGSDTLWGDAGNDKIFAGTIADKEDDPDELDFNVLDGGDGNDTLYGVHVELDDNGDVISYEDNNIVDYLIGGPGRDIYYAGAGDIIIDDGLGTLNDQSIDDIQPQAIPNTLDEINLLLPGQAEPIKVDGSGLSGNQEITEPIWRANSLKDDAYPDGTLIPLSSLKLSSIPSPIEPTSFTEDTVFIEPGYGFPYLPISYEEETELTYYRFLEGTVIRKNEAFYYIRTPEFQPITNGQFQLTFEYLLDSVPLADFDDNKAPLSQRNNIFIEQKEDWLAFLASYFLAEEYDPNTVMTALEALSQQTDPIKQKLLASAEIPSFGNDEPDPNDSNPDEPTPTPPDTPIEPEEPPNPLENPIEPEIPTPPQLNWNPEFSTFSTSGDAANISLDLTQRITGEIREIGFFLVDDKEGIVDNIAPQTIGYADKALERSQVVFSILTDPPTGFTTQVSRTIGLNRDSHYRFYAIKNGTTDDVLSGRLSRNQIVFSTADSIQVSSTADNSFTLAWEDGEGAIDFVDVQIQAQLTGQPAPIGTSLQSSPQSEILDFRALAGREITANFTVQREAAFDNYVGFYQITDTNGSVLDPLTAQTLKPGNVGYMQAAFGNRVAGIDLATANQTTTMLSGAFEGGFLFAPFIITNGTLEQLLDRDTANGPAVYFPYLSANSDGADHIRLLGDNIFGFEDLPGGGDADYNDMVISARFTVA